MDQLETCPPWMMEHPVVTEGHEKRTPGICVRDCSSFTRPCGVFLLIGWLWKIGFRTPLLFFWLNGWHGSVRDVSTMEFYTPRHGLRVSFRPSDVPEGHEKGPNPMSVWGSILCSHVPVVVLRKPLIGWLKLSELPREYLREYCAGKNALTFVDHSVSRRGVQQIFAKDDFLILKRAFEWYKFHPPLSTSALFASTIWSKKQQWGSELLCPRKLDSHFLTSACREKLNSCKNAFLNTKHTRILLELNFSAIL